MKPAFFRTGQLLLAFSLLPALPSSALVVTVPGVVVGDVNNPADSNTGFGSVGYTYAMGEYETTLGQYNAFLNAVAKTDTYGLWNSQMSGPPNTRGIARAGVSGTYSYSVIGDANRPITYVSWFDAARFANWLQNGQPTGLQTGATTETGAYALNGATTGVGFSHSANAQFWLPSQDEWYKAAYYQPAANGGNPNNYWLYPTRSNTQPNSRNGSTTDPNSANYYYDDGIANGYNGGYAVSDSTPFPIANALTDVGAFTLASSYYGTFDQGGNVAEWDDLVSGSGRAIVGGGFTSTAVVLQSTMSINVSTPDSVYGDAGFRLAMAVPEPATGSLLVLALALFARRRLNH